jgi:hypothetical protein
MQDQIVKRAGFVLGADLQIFPKAAILNMRQEADGFSALARKADQIRRI